MRLMAGGEEFSALTSALTDLHSELGDALGTADRPVGRASRACATDAVPAVVR